MADRKLRVGPIPSGSYIYRIGNRRSESLYANAESARADGRRPQRINTKGNLEPDIDSSGDDEMYQELSKYGIL